MGRGRCYYTKPRSSRRCRSQCRCRGLAQSRRRGRSPSRPRGFSVFLGEPNSFVAPERALPRGKLNLRLKQIKLAGFKSFVDPTSFDVPGQLVGVVGPNGCGKSNIMDAVRWVLGESKASELRGESMQDVIF